MPPTNTTASQEKPPEASKLTPEMIRKIADRVYAMFIADLKIERERDRLRIPRTKRP